ncbi:hypothetical protein Tco_0532247 [Tanacetum coccineum]
MAAIKSRFGGSVMYLGSSAGLSRGYEHIYFALRVYEDELKRSSGSNSASQNFAFLSSENTGSTNKVSTASRDFGVSTSGGINQVL